MPPQSTGWGFFDTLGTDELILIARYISARPRSKDWVDYLCAEDGQLLFRQHAPFRRAFVNDNYVVRAGQLTWNHASRTLTGKTRDGVFQQRLCGVHENTVSPRSVTARSVIPDQVVAELIRQSEGPKTLWFARFSSRLSLEVSISRLAPFSDTHPLPIRRINMVGTHASRNCGRIIEACGSSLHKIMLPRDLKEDLAESSTIFQALRKHCPNLKEISLFSVMQSVEYMEEYADLLMSYGSQLIRATLCRPFRTNPDLLCQVLRKCPNVIPSDFRVLHNRFDESVVSLLAPRLYCVTFCLLRCEEIEYSRTAAVFDACSNVQELHCTVLSSHLLRHFFSQCKPTLRTISVKVRLTLDHALLKSMARSSRSLRNLMLQYRKCEDNELLLNLVQLTKDTLETLRLVENDVCSVQEAVETTRDLLQSCRDHKRLREVELSFPGIDALEGDLGNSIKATAQQFRLRGTRIEVCGTVYVN